MGTKIPEYNQFIASEIYPDLGTIFKMPVRPIKDIVKDCLFVLDTNTLLMPYKTGKESLEQIKQTYVKLVAEKRLFLPGQVVREFAKNRPLKMCELHQQLLDRKSKLERIKGDKYPLLEGIEEYGNMIEAEKTINGLINECKQHIDAIVKHVSDWNWDDPVSLAYGEVFIEDTLIDIEFDKDELLLDLKRRDVHKIPPGYKDASKADDGIGDLLIWKTILELGKNQKKDIIFVSSDSKADWWHKSQSLGIYTRFELINEFLRHTGGKTIHIIQLSSLLGLYDVSKPVVDEVKIQEVETGDNENAGYPIIEGSNQYLLNYYLAKLEKDNIFFEDIKVYIDAFRSDGITEFSTAKLIKKITSGGYEKGNPINMAIGRVLSEAKDELSIAPARKSSEIDDLGNTTSTTVWRID